MKRVMEDLELQLRISHAAVVLGGSVQRSTGSTATWHTTKHFCLFVHVASDDARELHEVIYP